MQEHQFKPEKLIRNQSIYTERCYLRPVRIGDKHNLFEHMKNPDISRYMSWSPHKSINETTEVIEKLVNDRNSGAGITWCIFHKDESGSFMGIFSLISIISSHRSLRYDQAELAYWLVPEYQGKGIMTEVGKAIIDHAFMQLGMHKLRVGHMDVNTDSMSLIKRLGFRYIGVEIKHFNKHGRWHDHHIYELLYNDYIDKGL